MMVGTVEIVMHKQIQGLVLHHVLIVKQVIINLLQVEVLLHVAHVYQIVPSVIQLVLLVQHVLQMLIEML